MRIPATRVDKNQRFADTTAPNSKWWDGTYSNLDIFAITQPNTTVSFQTRLFGTDGLRTIRGKSTPGRKIPDNTANGITDTIGINDDATIVGIKVKLDIIHTYRGDLRVTLQSPWGDGIVLYQPGQGGSADNIQRMIDESDLQMLATLHGHSTKGDWRLVIQDLAAGDEGTLNDWALEFTTSGQPQGQVILEEAPGMRIPDPAAAGIYRDLSTNAAGNVGSVEVSVDITHTFVADLRISLRSPAGSEVILRDNTGGSSDDDVETYTVTTTPSIANLAQEAISGTWRLGVADSVGQDVGKLNRWQVVIRPVP